MNWVRKQLAGTEYAHLADVFVSDFERAGITANNVRNIPVQLRTFYGADPDKLVELLVRPVVTGRRKRHEV